MLVIKHVVYGRKFVLGVFTPYVLNPRRIAILSVSMRTRERAVTFGTPVKIVILLESLCTILIVNRNYDGREAVLYLD